MSVCVCVCLTVCVCESVYQIPGNSKNNGSIHLQLEHIVVYKNSFDIFLHLPQYKLSSPISQLLQMLGSCD